MGKKARRKIRFKFPAVVLEPVKTFLREELRRLRTRHNQIKKEDPFSDLDRVNSNAVDTDADEQFGHARSEAIGGQLSKKIIQVRKALARIKIGRYGICEKCGKFIDTGRLMIYPETTLCVDCKRKQSEEN